MRVEIIQNNETGNCARVRHITVEPEPVVAATPSTPSLPADPCVNYGGTWVTVNSNIRVCTTPLAWGTWNPASIPSPWVVCNLALWATYAPGAPPASFGLPTFWINNNSCGPGSHHEIYVSYPMNDANCYDGPGCCWGDSTVIPFAVCRP